MAGPQITGATQGTTGTAKQAAMVDIDDDDEEEVFTFEQLFEFFSQFGDPKSDGTKICLTQSDKWMKHANILDGRKITTTHTGVLFSKFKRRAVNQADYMTFLQDLANEKNLDLEADIIEQMVSRGKPTIEQAEILHHLDRLNYYAEKFSSWHQSPKDIDVKNSSDGFFLTPVSMSKSQKSQIQIWKMNAKGKKIPSKELFYK